MFIYVLYLRPWRDAKRTGLTTKQILAAALLSPVVNARYFNVADPRRGVNQPPSLYAAVACVDDFVSHMKSLLLLLERNVAQIDVIGSVDIVNDHFLSAVGNGE